LPRPPSWIPFLGPVLAAVAGALAGRFWLDGSFWTVLVAGLVCGFLPILGHRLWRWAHHRRDRDRHSDGRPTDGDVS